MFEPTPKIHFAERHRTDSWCCSAQGPAFEIVWWAEEGTRSTSVGGFAVGKVTSPLVRDMMDDQETQIEAPALPSSASSHNVGEPEIEIVEVVGANPVYSAVFVAEKSWLGGEPLGRAASRHDLRRC